MLKAHNHAFWIYGVIVGLAIREGLVKVISEGISSAHPISPHDRWLQAIRLVIFLGMIIRFYLGSAIYFDEVYCSPDADKSYPTKNYGFDFLFGLLHFILFFGWSETLTLQDRFAHGLSSFLLLLGVILLYDLLWWLSNLKYSTKVTIRVWAILNALTVGAGYLFLLFFNSFEWFSSEVNEIIALLPVAFMTLADFGEMISKKNLVTEFIVRTLGRAGVRS